jgi:hypothetical protein
MAANVLRQEITASSPTSWLAFQSALYSNGQLIKRVVIPISANIKASILSGDETNSTNRHNPNTNTRMGVNKRGIL